MALEKKEARAEKEEAEKYQKIQQEMVSYYILYVCNCPTGKCVLVKKFLKCVDEFQFFIGIFLHFQGGFTVAGTVV